MKLHISRLYAISAAWFLGIIIFASSHPIDKHRWNHTSIADKNDGVGTAPETAAESQRHKRFFHGLKLLRRRLLPPYRRQHLDFDSPSPNFFHYRLITPLLSFRLHAGHHTDIPKERPQPYLPAETTTQRNLLPTEQPKNTLENSVGEAPFEDLVNNVDTKQYEVEEIVEEEHSHSELFDFQKYKEDIRPKTEFWDEVITEASVPLTTKAIVDSFREPANVTTEASMVASTRTSIISLIDVRTDDFFSEPANLTEALQRNHEESNVVNVTEATTQRAEVIPLRSESVDEGIKTEDTITTTETARKVDAFDKVTTETVQERAAAPSINPPIDKLKVKTEEIYGTEAERTKGQVEEAVEKEKTRTTTEKTYEKIESQAEQAQNQVPEKSQLTNEEQVAQVSDETQRASLQPSRDNHHEVEDVVEVSVQESTGKNHTVKKSGESERTQSETPEEKKEAQGVTEKPGVETETQDKNGGALDESVQPNDTLIADIKAVSETPVQGRTEEQLTIEGPEKLEMDTNKTQENVEDAKDVSIGNVKEEPRQEALATNSENVVQEEDAAEDRPIDLLIEDNRHEAVETHSKVDNEAREQREKYFGDENEIVKKLNSVEDRLFAIYKEVKPTNNKELLTNAIDFRMGAEITNVTNGNASTTELTKNKTMAEVADEPFNSTQADKEPHEGSLTPMELLQENLTPEFLLKLIPVIVHDIRNSTISSEEKQVLANMYGKLWPDIERLAEDEKVNVRQLFDMDTEEKLEAFLGSLYNTSSRDEYVDDHQEGVVHERRKRGFEGHEGDEGAAEQILREILAGQTEDYYEEESKEHEFYVYDPEVEVGVDDSSDSDDFSFLDMLGVAESHHDRKYKRLPTRGHQRHHKTQNSKIIFN